MNKQEKRNQNRNFAYSRNQGEMAEVIIRDATGRRLDTFKFAKHQAPKISKILHDKYDFDFRPTIPFQDSVNEREKEKSIVEKEVDKEKDLFFDN